MNGAGGALGASTQEQACGSEKKARAEGIGARLGGCFGLGLRACGAQDARPLSYRASGPRRPPACLWPFRAGFHVLPGLPVELEARWLAQSEALCELVELAERLHCAPANACYLWGWTFPLPSGLRTQNKWSGLRCLFGEGLTNYAIGLFIGFGDYIVAAIFDKCIG